LWRAVGLKRISEADAEEALEAWNDMRIEMHGLSWAQTAQALNIACDLDQRKIPSSKIRAWKLYV